MTWRELHGVVSRLQQMLVAEGVGEGDRVAACLPNIPEAVAAMLAAASIGAVWSSASPDFGPDGIVDRFGQIEPKVLLVVDGYRYGGKEIDVADKVRAVVPRLPGLRRTVVVPMLGKASELASSIPGGRTLDDALAPFAAREVTFARLPFAHPLLILFSSGTTGVPKCIVHSAGGTLLQHLKEHRLQSDIGAGDRVFYFTTLGWMMWNWLVSALASDATLLLFDGSPAHPDPDVLFDYADREGATFFGTSAKFIDSVKKSGHRPADLHAFPALRTIASTGSPLVAESFDFVYDAIKQDVHLASISGGTDIVSCFVLGVPTLPVWRGEIQGRGSAWRSTCSTRTAIRLPRARASWSAPAPSRPCRSASGTTPTAPAIAPPISSAFPASGATAILPSGRCMGASSSMAAPTPRSIRAGCASAPAKSTVR